MLIYGEVGARSIDCFIQFGWQTGDEIWLVSRSVSDNAWRDSYRWWDSDTSQSLASAAVVLAPPSANPVCAMYHFQ